VPDLRLNAGSHGLAVAQGVVDTSNVSKADAEKLLAQISASLIGSSGKPRSGYLKVRTDEQGNIRFTAGHWGRDEKAAAAKLMLGLAAKAWGAGSVDTQALEKYLRSPDRRPDQNVAENARQLGSVSLLKLLSNRHLTYREMNRQPFEGADPAVSRLQTYGDRFLRAASRHAGRLSLGEGPGASRTNEIKQYAPAASAPGSAPAGAVKAEQSAPAQRAKEVARAAVDMRHEAALSDFAKAVVRPLTEDSRKDLERLRIEAMKSFQTRLFDQKDPVQARFVKGQPEFKLKGAYATQKLDDLARGLGLTHLDDWRGGIGRAGELNSDATRVLLSDDLVESGEAYLQAQEALDDLQAGFRKNVFLPQNGIEKLMTTFWERSGEARPNPARAANYGKPGVASNALRRVTEFFAEASPGRPYADFLRLDRPTPLDYALMGIKGVDSLNRGPINDILRQLPKEHWRAGATPHAALLIQTLVDEFNQRVMGGPYESQPA